MPGASANSLRPNRSACPRYVQRGSGSCAKNAIGCRRRDAMSPRPHRRTPSRLRVNAAWPTQDERRHFDEDSVAVRPPAHARDPDRNARYRAHCGTNRPCIEFCTLHKAYHAPMNRRESSMRSRPQARRALRASASSTSSMCALCAAKPIATRRQRRPSSFAALFSNSAIASRLPEATEESLH